MTPAEDIEDARRVCQGALSRIADEALRMTNAAQRRLSSDWQVTFLLVVAGRKIIDGVALEMAKEVSRRELR